MAERVSIRNLQADKPGQLLVAMIIFYKDPRGFKGNVRGVWNVTLRDSPEDTVNMAVWGSFKDLKELVKNLKFGDVVEIHDPRVQIRIMDDKFCPHVSSPFMLTLNDAGSTKSLLMWDAPPEEVEAWGPLLAIPTKPPQSYSKLSDVQQMGPPVSPDQERLVNLLVVIGSVGEARTGQTKSSEEYVFRRLTVYDRSGPNKSIPITVWNSLAERAGCWTPKETNAKIEWKEERIGISLHHKSIVTENPSIPDADWLRAYAAQNAPMNNLEILQDFVATISDPSTINDTVTINTLLNKCEEGRKVPWEQAAFTALMYVGVIGFHIDDPKDRTLRPQCSICKCWLATYDAQCYNSQCVNSPDRFTRPVFDFRVDLADHTGELRGCRLNGRAAETVLNCTESQFDEATEAQISAVKWRFLLERVVVRIAALPPSTPNGNALVSILYLELANPLDVAQNIPIQ